MQMGKPIFPTAAEYHRGSKTFLNYFSKRS